MARVNTKRNAVITALQPGATAYEDLSRLGRLVLDDGREFRVELFAEHDGIFGLRQLADTEHRRSAKDTTGKVKKPRQPKTVKQHEDNTKTR